MILLLIIGKKIIKRLDLLNLIIHKAFKGGHSSIQIQRDTTIVWLPGLTMKCISVN